MHTRLIAATLLALLATCGPRQEEPGAGSAIGIRLTHVPSMPAGARIYLAGSFNGWDPAAHGFELRRHRDGSYTFVLPEEARGRRLEFKFTLGSWETVETDSAGADVPNRSYVVPEHGADVYIGSVAAWRDPSSPREPPPSTAGPTVSVAARDFAIPQLGRARRVWVYLPPDYATSTRRYPVLYMHDGQNVFDDATAFAGEWGVDETLDSLHALGRSVAIVVAVDHAGERRFDEYSPWRHPLHGGGEGDAYVDFLAHTLKTWVDANYRTLPDRANTAVAGSSMGGLISLYAALTHPDVFGRAGVFSPALWVTPQFFDYVDTIRPDAPRPRLWFVSGAQEGETPEAYVRDQNRMVDALERAGFRRGRDLSAHVASDGTHSEWFWRREFPAAYDWLFAGTSEPQEAALLNSSPGLERR